MTIHVRAFEQTHYAAARQLWESTAGIGLSEADSPVAVNAFLERNPGLSLVALDSDLLVGTLLVGHDGRRGLIHHLAVADSHRRRGIGRHLVDEGLAGLGRAGIQKCHLLVFADNEPARAFWQAIGAEHREALAVYSLATR